MGESLSKEEEEEKEDLQQGLPQPKTPEEEAEQRNIVNAFNAMDKDGTGTIDSRELALALEPIVKMKIHDEDAQWIMSNVLDKDHDGQMSLREFYAFVTKHIKDGKLDKNLVGDAIMDESMKAFADDDSPENADRLEDTMDAFQKARRNRPPSNCKVSYQKEKPPSNCVWLSEGGGSYTVPYLKDLPTDGSLATEVTIKDPQGTAALSIKIISSSTRISEAGETLLNEAMCLCSESAGDVCHAEFHACVPVKGNAHMFIGHVYGLQSKIWATVKYHYNPVSPNHSYGGQDFSLRVGPQSRPPLEVMRLCRSFGPKRAMLGDSGRLIATVTLNEEGEEEQKVFWYSARFEPNSDVGLAIMFLAVTDRFLAFREAKRGKDVVSS